MPQGAPRGAVMARAKCGQNAHALCAGREAASRRDVVKTTMHDHGKRDAACLLSSPLELGTLPAFPTMTPLQLLPSDPHAAFHNRAVLMAKPPEFFLHIFEGRMPSIVEKTRWIEERVQQMARQQIFANDLYVVSLENQGVFWRMSIQRRDGQPCREWKHMQQIKNELFGPRYEAVELYPAEDRLVDTNNEYHLWVHADPNFRFPIGFQVGRCVTPQPAVEAAPRYVVATNSDHAAAVN